MPATVLTIILMFRFGAARQRNPRSHKFRVARTQNGLLRPELREIYDVTSKIFANIRPYLRLFTIFIFGIATLTILLTRFIGKALQIIE